ncbi:MAG: ArgE/DapE family deacylase [Armatimonadetes bacterium]|nr:ArgE/DapE family deacylase [Armatimonadota bacterium]
MSVDITCESISRKIDSYRDEGLAWLTDSIRFRSVQGCEQEQQAYWKRVLESLGFAPEYREIPDSLMEDPDYCHNESECSYEGRYNLVTNWGQGQGRSLIVQSHSDVVPADDWDGFTPRWDGEYVWGRGATDCKGCQVSALLAMKALKDLGYEPAGRLELQFVIEEEPGGNGALALIRQGCQADACIVIEASDLNVFPANRGAVWFKARTTGISTHMGRRHEGVNAIEKMMEALRQMLIYEEELIAASKGNPLFDRYDNPVQVCIGMIQAGQWPSKVPDECVVEGGVGFLPNKSIAEVRAELEAAVMRTEDEWLKSHFELTYPKLKKDAYQIDPNHAIVTTLQGAVQECGRASEVYGWNVSCDAALYAKMAGIPTVVFGPSDIREAHGRDEKIRYQDVLDCAKALALAIPRWCG